MSEKPIFFTYEMVQAILDGRKTMTRRVVKEQPPNELFWLGWITSSTDSKLKGCACWSNSPDETKVHYVKLPYKIGDILWVKETWRDISIKPHLAHTYLYRADWHPDNVENSGRWESSRLMPRAAARLFLKVTNVRVERLQDIKEQDILAEGIPYDQETFEMPCNLENAGETYLKGEFLRFWNSLYANRGYKWDINPWVCVIEFERAVEAQ